MMLEVMTQLLDDEYELQTHLFSRRVSFLQTYKHSTKVIKGILSSFNFSWANQAQMECSSKVMYNTNGFL